jgi:ABC-type amino acid transport system permease subunit
MYQAVTLESQTFAVFEVFTGVWISYLVITIPVSRAAQAIEGTIKWRRV